MPWWLAGLSMVATTFSSDTPYPGWAALVPVFATVLLLISGDAATVRQVAEIVETIRRVTDNSAAAAIGLAVAVLCVAFIATAAQADGKAKAQVCTACHGADVLRPLAMGCFDCHAAQDVHKAQLGAQCGAGFVRG